MNWVGESRVGLLSKPVGCYSDCIVLLLIEHTYPVLPELPSGLRAPQPWTTLAWHPGAGPCPHPAKREPSCSVPALLSITPGLSIKTRALLQIGTSTGWGAESPGASLGLAHSRSRCRAAAPCPSCVANALPSGPGRNPGCVADACAPRVGARPRVSAQSYVLWSPPS